MVVRRVGSVVVFFGGKGLLTAADGLDFTCCGALVLDADGAALRRWI